MGYSWFILASAVEQKIIFPSKGSFDSYIKSLDFKGSPYQIISSDELSDGTLIVLIRKSYNNTNFLEGRSSDE